MYVVTTNYNQDLARRHTAVQTRLTTRKPIIVAGETLLPDQTTLRHVSSNVVLALLTILTNSFAVLIKYTQRNKTKSSRAAVVGRYLTKLKIYVAGQMCTETV
jgi:hypothetical protein